MNYEQYVKLSRSRAELAARETGEPFPKFTDSEVLERVSRIGMEARIFGVPAHKYHELARASLMLDWSSRVSENYGVTHRVIV